MPLGFCALETLIKEFRFEYMQCKFCNEYLKVNWTIVTSHLNNCILITPGRSTERLKLTLYKEMVYKYLFNELLDFTHYARLGLISSGAADCLCCTHLEKFWTQRCMLDTRYKSFLRKFKDMKVELKDAYYEYVNFKAQYHSSNGKIREAIENKTTVGCDSFDVFKTKATYKLMLTESNHRQNVDLFVEEFEVLIHAIFHVVKYSISKTKNNIQGNPEAVQERKIIYDFVDQQSIRKRQENKVPETLEHIQVHSPDSRWARLSEEELLEIFRTDFQTLLAEKPTLMAIPGMMGIIRMAQQSTWYGERYQAVMEWVNRNEPLCEAPLYIDLLDEHEKSLVDRHRVFRRHAANITAIIKNNNMKSSELFSEFYFVENEVYAEAFSIHRFLKNAKLFRQGGILSPDMTDYVWPTQALNQFRKICRKNAKDFVKLLSDMMKKAEKAWKDVKAVKPKRASKVFKERLAEMEKGMFFFRQNIGLLIREAELLTEKSNSKFDIIFNYKFSDSFLHNFVLKYRNLDGAEDLDYSAELDNLDEPVPQT